MRLNIIVMLLIYLGITVSISCADASRNANERITFPKKTDEPQAWIKYARNTSHDTFIEETVGSILYNGKLNRKPIFNNFSLQRGGLIAADKQIYVPNDEGRLVAIDTVTGEVVWLSRPQLSSNRQFTSSTYHKGYLYCGTQPGGLACIDITTGKVVWEQKEHSGIKGVRTCPAVTDDSVFFLDVESRAYMLDPLSGKAKWSLDLTRTEMAMSDPLSFESAYIFGTPSGLFQSVNTEGNTVWVSALANSIESTPVRAGNSVFFTGLDGCFYKVNAADGNLVFKTQLEGRSSSTTLMHNGKAVVSDDENFIYCISTETGEKLWKLEVEGIPQSLFLGFEDCIVAFSSMNSIYHRTDLTIPVTQNSIDKFLKKKAPFEVITSEDAEAFSALSGEQDRESKELIPKPVELEDLKTIFPKGIEALFARHTRMYVISWDGAIKSETALPTPLQTSPIYYEGKIYILDSEGFINVFKCDGV
jgi:outer membrane protein assembly factor BamB